MRIQKNKSLGQHRRLNPVDITTGIYTSKLECHVEVDKVTCKVKKYKKIKFYLRVTISLSRRYGIPFGELWTTRRSLQVASHWSQVTRVTAKTMRLIATKDWK